MTKETQDKPVLASAIWRPVRASELEILDARGRRIAFCTYPDECAAMVESINQLPAIKAENEALRELAYCALRVQNLTKENFPHRSPAWVYDHPDTPIKIAMNNLLHQINKYEKSLAALALTGGRHE